MPPVESPGMYGYVFIFSGANHEEQFDRTLNLIAIVRLLKISFIFISNYIESFNN